ncbi:hypothetical protein H4R19_001204, partial [Coemansia spiralis]
MPLALGDEAARKLRASRTADGPGAPHEKGPLLPQLSLPPRSPARLDGPPVARHATGGAQPAEHGLAPVSPLVAASTAGEHYPTHQLSYAHQQSISGWDKVFAHISQRSEAMADDGHAPAPGHPRLPGIGEDDSVQGDVQYVYEYALTPHPPLLRVRAKGSLFLPGQPGPPP